MHLQRKALTSQTETYESCKSDCFKKCLLNKSEIYIYKITLTFSTYVTCIIQETSNLSLKLLNDSTNCTGVMGDFRNIKSYINRKLETK